MVWGLFPSDPHSGEDGYYIFCKGTYKVGRKGCEVIINKDKGVSRVHAEIYVDSMATPNANISKLDVIPAPVRIRDGSKYGTVITRSVGLKEKIHEFPNKEANMKDGDLISFGTGNATYRFSLVPLVFFVYCSGKVSPSLEDKVSAIGACISKKWSPECTHVLVDGLVPVKEDLVDAVAAKKQILLDSWVEFVAERKICTEIPSSSSSYAPSLKLEGISVTVADPKTREKCLEGYTFLLEASHLYRFGNRTHLLLEVGGAKVLPAEKYCGSEDRENVVCVIPYRPSDKSKYFQNHTSLTRVDEMKLISAVLSGYLDRFIFVAPSLLVLSSSSTEETVVADSDAEAETETSIPAKAVSHTEESIEIKIVGERSTDLATTMTTEMETVFGTTATAHAKEISNTESKWEQTTGRVAGSLENRVKAEESESTKSDILYSQDLIVREVNFPASAHSAINKGVVNFKHFRKSETQSGNSFNNLVPFSKHPYKDSDYGSEDVARSVKEEKKRKQMEAIAEDLFNNVKGKRQGAASSLRGLLTRS